jgi:Protein of unknown function (DUF3078)
MRYVLLAVCVLVSVGAVGQTQTATDTEKKIGAAGVDADTVQIKGWKVNAVVGAGLSQAAFSNWAQGGENSFAYTLSGLVNGTLHGERSRWSNTLSLRYGQAQIGSDEAKKTDDEIYFESIFVYRVWSPFHPYGAATIRTQFAPGYNYPDNAPRVRVSKFFDPAYLTQSVGVIYEPSPIFTSRLGVAAREVLTSDFPQYADDPETLTEIEKTRVDLGMEWVSTLNYEFLPNMVYVTRLELFAPFTAFDRVVVRWDNVISGKINNWFSVNLGVQVLNDVNVTPRTQLKQTLTLGVSYQLL